MVNNTRVLIVGSPENYGHIAIHPYCFQKHTNTSRCSDLRRPGYFYEQLDYVIRLCMQYSFLVDAPTDGNWGDVSGNSPYELYRKSHGLFRDLLDRRIDLTVPMLDVTPNRYKAVIVSDIVNFYHRGFLVGESFGLQQEAFQYWRIFSLATWIYWISGVSVLYLVSLAAKSTRNEPATENVVDIIIQLSLLIMSAAFGSSIISIQSVSVRVLPFSNIRDAGEGVLRHGYRVVAPNNSSASTTIIENSSKGMIEGLNKYPMRIERASSMRIQLLQNNSKFFSYGQSEFNSILIQQYKDSGIKGFLDIDAPVSLKSFMIAPHNKWMLVPLHRAIERLQECGIRRAIESRYNIMESDPPPKAEITDANSMYDPLNFKLPSVITHSWIERVVLRYHSHKHSDVQACLVDFRGVARIDKENSGVVSIPIKVELQWKPSHKTLPKSLIVKQFTLEKLMEMCNANAEDERITCFKKVHNNECRFYDTILHTIRDLPVPQCYYAQECNGADDVDPGFLLLEDLSDGIIVDFYDGFTLNQIYSISDCVAALQAHSLNNWETFNSHKNFDEPRWPMDSVSRTFFFNAIKERYQEEFKDISNEDAKKLSSNEKFYEVCYGESPFPVLVHGDLWTNNILWVAENERATDKVLAILDWQGGHLGNPGEDFARLLLLHLSPTDRREHEEDILKRYYRQLQQLTEGRVPFEFHYVLTWYRKSMASQSIIGCLNHMMKPWIKTKAPSETLHVARRVSEAMRDALKYVDLW